MPLTLTDLPTDIHDTIAAFLSDKDLIEFVCASRQIIVSPYLLRQRQRALKCGVETLAKKGDLVGLQYLHGLIGGSNMAVATTLAAMYGHLAVVQYLHGSGANTAMAGNGAAMNGHLAVVQFLHSVGAHFSDVSMRWAKEDGHLAVVEFLQSVGVH